MADDERFDDERPDDDRDPREERSAPRQRRPRQDTEGVRIIGAEEARTAYEGDREPQGRRPRFPVPEERPQTPGTGAEPESEPPGDELESGPAERPPVGGQLFGERPGSGAGPQRAEDQPTGAVELPHWTEPPTGEVPVAGGRQQPTGPNARFRDADSDWDDSDMSDLADQEGGLLPSADEEITDDEAFEREVEARRRQARESRRAGGAPPPSRGVGRQASPRAHPAQSSGVRRIPADASASAPRQQPPPMPPRRQRPPEEAPTGRQPERDDEPRGPRLGEGGLEPGMTEPPPIGPSGSSERDLPTAILTGVAMGVAALLLFNWGRGPTSFLVAAIATLATSEMYVALRARGYRPAVPVGLAATAGLVLGSYDRGFEGFVIVLGLAIITSLVWFLIQAEDARPTVNVGLTMLPILYVGGLASFGGLLLAFPNGIGMLLGVVIAVVAYDVAGYFVGSRIGTRRIAPEISPNKTSEGLLAGIVASVVISLIIVRAIHPWDAGSALWLGVIVGVAAPVGDLIESMIKRDIGIKDFGSIIPGHGGLLDRFDAILFSLPPAFFLVRVLEIF